MGYCNSLRASQGILDTSNFDEMILLIEDTTYNLLADLLALTKESYQPPSSLEHPWDGLLTCCGIFGFGICLMDL